MTTPPPVLTNAADVATRLHELVQVQTSVAQALAQADRDAVTARLAYDHAYSRAFITEVGSMDLRRQVALDATHGLRVKAETADLTVRNLKRRLDSIRTEIDVTRSIGAGIRVEVGAFTSGGVR